MKRFRLVAALVVLALAGCRPVAFLQKGYLSACPGAGPEERQDFSIRVLPFELAEHYDIVRSFQGALQVTDIARVTHENGSYPIYLVQRRGGAASRRALIVAAVHGNELAPVLAAQHLLARLAAAPRTYERWDVYVVPVVNPVGVAHRSRYNGQGCDINRDFQAFRTAEARMLRDIVHEVAPDLIVSLKEGPQDGFMVIVTAAGSREVGVAVAGAVGRAGIPLAGRSSLHLGLSVPGLSVEGPVVTRLKTLLGMHTLASYARTLGIATYTTESDWASPDIERRVRSHEIAVDAVLGAT